MLLAAKSKKRKISGLIGLAAAVDFGKDLFNSLSTKNKHDIKTKGITKYTYKGFAYYLTKEFFIHCTKNKILNKKISQNINVTMVHGSKDKSVPVIYSKKVLKIFQSKKKKLVVIKNGDHSLSSPKWLKILKKELKVIIN